MAITLKQGDSYPELDFILSDANGPVSLATVSSITLTAKSGATTISLTATADADQVANKGKASAAIATTDTATAGTYDVEVKVVWTTGQEQRFPNTGYESMTIEDHLA